MNAHGIEVLHIAYRDAIIGAVADDFVFDFFPAFKVFLDQNLRGMGKGFFEGFMELLLVL
jgi:hypothetical protein